MQLNKLLKYYCSLSCVVYYLLFSGGCANRMAPTGGPKDSLNPFVVESIPRNQSILFKGDLLIVRFNEWIKEKNLKKELLITPNLKEYTYKIIRNRLELYFNDTLRPNTTYSFNFRQGLVDITEGNVALYDTLKRENLKIAFSTGSFIDSMSVSGQVFNFLTNKPVKESVVSLYKVGDTLRIHKHQPYYYTLTDEDGNFDFRNIQNTAYQIYAFTDKNADGIYQEPELIGFLENPLVFKDSSASVSGVRLKVVKEDQRKPELLYQRAIGDDVELELSEGILEWNVEVLDDKFKGAFVDDVAQKGKVIKFYGVQQPLPADSIPLRITAIDSANNLAQLDTKIAFKQESEKDKVVDEKKGRRNKNTVKEKLKFEIKLPTGSGFEKELKMDWFFDKPVALFDFQKIKYRIDGDTLTPKVFLFRDSTTHYTWNKARSQLSIHKKINFKQKLELIVDSAAFISIKGDSSASFKNSFPLKNVDDFGTISGTVNTQQTHFIVQLLDEKSEVIKEVKNSKKYDFAYLPAGNYRLRVVIDRNKNGKWDSSNVLENSPPEEIIFFDLPANGKLKERWDIEGGELVF